MLAVSFWRNHLPTNKFTLMQFCKEKYRRIKLDIKISFVSLCLVALSWLFWNFEYQISTPFSRQFFWLYSHVSPILNKCKNCKRKTFVCNSKLHTCVRKLREIASHLSSSFITVLNKDFKGFQKIFLGRYALCIHTWLLSHLSDNT